MQLELFQPENNSFKISVLNTFKGPKSKRKISYLKAGIPRLVLQGKWMARLGITVGDTVQIDYGPDKIVIKIKGFQTA